MNIIRHVVIVNVWDINDAQSMNVMRDINMIHECYQGCYYKDCYSDIIMTECSEYHHDAQSMNVIRDIIVTVNVIRDIMLL